MPNQYRQRLRSGVSTVVLTMALTGALMSAAHAASTNASYAIGAPGVYLDQLLVNGVADPSGDAAINSYLSNEQLVQAAINAGAISGALDIEGNASSFVINSNTATAAAIGNSANSTADLEVLSLDGIGIQHAAINYTSGAAVRSAVGATSFSLDAEATDGDVAGAFVNSDNTISAVTALNQSVIDSSGAIPNGFSDTTDGMIDFSFAAGAAEGLSTAGTLAIANAQINSLGVSGASSASTEGNSVTLSIAGDGDAVTASPLLDGNIVAADYTGNEAAAQVRIEVDESPSFTGSAVISNVQANLNGDVGAAPDHVNAANTGSAIEAAIGTGVDLAGGLSVADNTISSSAVGNRTGSNTAYGTVLRVDPTISVNGVSDTAANTVSFDEGGVVAGLSGDLAVLSSQANVASSIVSSTEDATIRANIDTLSGSSLMEANAIEAAATANRASTLISTSDPNSTDDPVITPVFDAVAALSNVQVNQQGSDVASSVNNADIATIVDSVDGSTVRLDGNQVASASQGNTGMSRLDLTANVLSLGGGTALATGGDLVDGTATATADASLVNLQANYSSAVTASTTDAVIEIDHEGGTIDGASLSNVDGAISSSALVNSAGNSIDLNGTTVSGAAALTNVQIAEGATVGALTSDIAFEIDTDGTIGNTTLAQTGNAISATADINRASSLIEASGTNLVLQTGSGASVPYAGGGLVFDSAIAQASAAGGLVALNSQLLDLDGIAATVQDGGFGIEVEGSTNASSVSNDGNAVSAGARGNSGATGIVIDAGAGLAALGDTAVASVVNIQSRGTGSAIIAEIENASVRSDLEGDVIASSVSASDSVFEAFARGNASIGTGNSLVVTGNAINATGEASGLTNFDAGAIVADLGFTVTSAQASAAGANVTANQQGTSVLADIEGNIGGSSVAVDGSQFVASAIDNSVLNTATIDVTGFAGSAGVLNVQNANAIATATVGLEGVPGTEGASYPSLTGSGTYSGDAWIEGPTGARELVLDDETVLTINLAGITGPEREALEAALRAMDFDIVGDVASLENQTGSELRKSADAFANFNFDTLTNSISFTGVEVAGDLGTAASPSVIAAIGGDITNSAVTVDGSRSLATAVSNSASNVLSLAAATAEGGAGLDLNEAAANIDLAGTFDLLADLGLGNTQSFGEDAGAVATANGTYAIVTEADETVSGSSLSVSSTLQQAVAAANEASNVLDVASTNLLGIEDVDPEDNLPGLTAGIVSTQGALAGDAVTATSWASIGATAAIEGSSLALDGNRNVASSVVNRNDNALSVAGVNIASLATEAASIDVDAVGETAVVDADYFAALYQASERDAAATATTIVGNLDRVEEATSGLVNSTVTASGNVTIAETRDNISTGLVSVGGEDAANIAATSGLANVQLSDGDLTATSDSRVALGLAGNGALDGIAESSTLTASGNQSAAIVVANRTTNTLSIAAANIGSVQDDVVAILGITHDSDEPTFEYDTSADHVLNSGQVSSGLATASATGMVSVSLSGDTDTTALLNSAIALSDNLTIAEARGNSASNTVDLDAGAIQSASAGLQNFQLREAGGNVTATATGGVTASAATGTGALSGSSIALTGNETAAIASANSATNVLNGTTGAGYGDGYVANAASSIALGSDGYTGNTAAGMAILNGQGNDADVRATAQNVAYTATLANGVGGSSAILNGNAISANASGNSVANTIALTGVADVLPSAALSTAQVNTGTVTAEVIGGQIGVLAGTPAAGVSGSSLSIGGNMISASAIGNSAVNVIRAR